ncbi:MAG: RidA family protein [Mycobacterium sp.]
MGDQFRMNFSSGSEFEAVVGYSRAVRTGPYVVVAGTTGCGPDAAAQARDALSRITGALEQVGARLGDVIRTRLFVTDIADWRAVAEVHQEFFGSVLPVATMVEVTALISPELLVEIEVDAYVDESLSGGNDPSAPAT